MSGNAHPWGFDETVLPHLDAAYNLARWLLRNEHDAQDAVQEGCLRAFRFFPTFCGGDGRAWFMTIVRNACYSQLRVKRPLREAAAFDEDITPPDSETPNPEDVLLQRDRGDLVRKALDELPVRFREVVVLRELEGMSYEEIADITGLPTGTVMSRLSRARARLRQTLTDRQSESGARTPGRVFAANAQASTSTSLRAWA